MDQNVRLLHWLWMSLWNMQDYILMVIYRFTDVGGCRRFIRTLLGKK